MLQPEDKIHLLVKSGYDQQYYESLYRQQRYAFGFELGDDMDGMGAPTGGGVFPIWPDAKIEYDKVGRSRRILANSFIQLSQLRAREVEPDFPGVKDEILREMRKCYWLGRAQGMDGTGGFTHEIDRAVFNGINFGLGVVRHGTTETKGGLIATVRNYSPLQFLYDGHADNIHRSRWCCFVTYYPVETAKELFGSAVESHVTTMVRTEAFPVEFVRVFEYYDLGIGGREPTEAVFLGDFGGEIVRRRRNELGFLPFSAYTHFFMPGMKRPVGRILQQQAVEKQINEYEELLDAANKIEPMLFVDESRIDKNDLARWAKGEPLKYLRYKQGTDANAREPFYQLTPGAQVGNYVFQRLEMLRRELSQQSGVSDFSRGIADKDASTATEATLIANQSSVQANWDVRQIALFFQDLVKKFTDIGREFDTAPLTVDVFGVDYTINDPKDPNTALSAILEDESPVLVTLEALYVQDQQRKRSNKLAELQALLAMGFNPARVQEEILKTLGYQDRDEWLPQAPGMDPSGGMGGPIQSPDAVPGEQTVSPPTTAALMG